MALITLTTDFGAGDYGVAEMKGAIWGIAPHARLIDLCHSIPAHDIKYAARLLEQCIPYFPTGTVHVFVVDPGVGTARLPVAARIGEHFFVGPDNGTLTRLLHKARAATISRAAGIELVKLDRPEFWLPEVSKIFHGRDIFAPCAAHLANGKTLQQIGSPLQSLVEIEI